MGEKTFWKIDVQHDSGLSDVLSLCGRWEEGWLGKGLKCGLDPKVPTELLSRGRDLVVMTREGERDFGQTCAQDLSEPPSWRPPLVKASNPLKPLRS